MAARPCPAGGRRGRGLQARGAGPRRRKGHAPPRFPDGHAERSPPTPRPRRGGRARPPPHQSERQHAPLSSPVGSHRRLRAPEGLAATRYADRAGAALRGRLGFVVYPGPPLLSVRAGLARRGDPGTQKAGAPYPPHRAWAGSELRSRGGRGRSGRFRYCHPRSQARQEAGPPALVGATHAWALPRPGGTTSGPPVPARTAAPSAGPRRSTSAPEAASARRLGAVPAAEAAARSRPLIRQMFPLVQRFCFHTPAQLQLWKLTVPRLPPYGKNKTTRSSLGLHHLHLISRTSSLNLASVYATKLQAFHTSLPSFKKKNPKESETKDLGVLQRSMKLLKDSPKPAVYISLAGLIPFVSIPLAMAVQGTYYPQLAFAQVTYGAVTASFLGGMRWGFALPENSPAKPDWLNLANSTVPPLFAWQALVFKDITHGAIMLIMALGIALHYDLSLLPTYPGWFKVLRVVGTLVMVLSLLATMIMKAFSEQQPCDSSNK